MTLLSIVTVVRNDRVGIAQTATSIGEQSETDWEWIVIDGASTDGTQQSIGDLAVRPASWVSEPDKGIYDAMNTGLARATGEWILFLNAGDVFCRPDTLSEVFPVLRATPCEWGFGAVRNIDSAGNATGVQCASPFTLNGLLLGNTTVPHQATFMRRSLTERLGKYSTDLGTEADQEYILRAARAEAPFEIVWPVADFRIGGRGMQRPVGHFPKAMRRARRSQGKPFGGSEIVDVVATGAVVARKYLDAIQDQIARRLNS